MSNTVDLVHGTMVRMICGDSRSALAALPDRSVHCCVTSPPYWGLRDYGVAGQVGLEKSADEYVAEIVAVFRDVHRVLREDGTLWLNLGDSYASGKQLLMVPARVAMALQGSGWILRSQIIWAKTNPMNEPCKDRPTSAWESVFLFSKQPKYFYDIDATRLSPSGRRDPIRSFGKTPSRNDGGRAYNLDALKGANARNVWPIATQKYDGAHFATMPPTIIEPCIQAGTSAYGCCPECGAQWRRLTERSAPGKETTRGKQAWAAETGQRDSVGGLPVVHSTTVGWRPTCQCDAIDAVPCTVLDPFGGAGTTGLVASRLGRDSVLVDLNPEYIAMAWKRLLADPER